MNDRSIFTASEPERRSNIGRPPAASYAMPIVIAALSIAERDVPS
jgi:hypothetical protein